ncbi:MAG: NAD-dependent deacylase [Anaerolineae bacterium]
MLEQLIQQAAQRLKLARHLVVLTGAGVSKESGIPTFRDAMEGLWAQYDPQDLATPAAFRRNPVLVWDWYEERRLKVGQVRPNPGHHALVALERFVPHVTIITQNVDGLHRAAGSQHVIELHGNITQHKCFKDCQGSPTLVDISRLTWEHAARPPRCPHCGTHLRPNVVWFTEALPQEALTEAFVLCETADVVLIVGTSGLVQPAASLPYVAKQRGSAFLIDVNPNRDELVEICDIYLQGASGVILPQVVEAMRNDA